MGDSLDRGQLDRLRKVQDRHRKAQKSEQRWETAAILFGMFIVAAYLAFIGLLVWLVLAAIQYLSRH